MRIHRLAPVLLIPALLIAAPAAEAKLKATASVAAKGTTSRLVVKLTSTKKLSRSTKPRSVKAKAAKTTYKLSRTAAARKSQSWRSKSLSGKSAAALAAHGGKAISVTVTTRRGKVTLKPKLALPKTGGGGGGGGGGVGGGLFARPPAPMIGQPAFDFISRYFVNSRITDCPPGWPNCAVEHRYNHCAEGGMTGGWEYRRLTPTSGADVNSIGRYQVASAEVKADGAWTIEYYNEAYGSVSFYHWEVVQDGSATGAYWGPGVDPRTSAPSERFTGYRWQQPAGCGTAY